MLATLPLLLILGGGCGGINSTQSVSPASFFLPGLLKISPPVHFPETGTPVGQLAQAN